MEVEIPVNLPPGVACVKNGGHRIGFILGSGHEITIEEFEREATHDGTGDGYMGCLNCCLPVELLTDESKKIAVEG